MQPRVVFSALGRLLPGFRHLPSSLPLACRPQSQHDSRVEEVRTTHFTRLCGRFTNHDQAIPPIGVTHASCSVTRRGRPAEAAA
jgi:hypothetical protein